MVGVRQPHDVRRDAARPLVPAGIARRVAGREHRLDRVHGGVEPAVGRLGGPRAVPLVDHQTGRPVPEVLLEDVERLGEEVVGAREAGHDRRRAGEHDEGVVVARLRGPDRGAGGVDRGEPPTVLGVAQRRTQPVEGSRGDVGAALVAEQRAQAEDVDRAARDPRVHRSRQVGPAVVVEPGGSASGVDDVAPEVEEATALGVEPRSVGRGDVHAVSQMHETPACRRGSRPGLVQWQVEDSNLCRRCRLIYSQLPLAARATCRAVRNNSKARTSLRIAGAPPRGPARRHTWLTRASTS